MVLMSVGDAAYGQHFDGKRFFNPGAAQARGLFDVLRWKWTSRPERVPAFVDDVSPAKPAPRVEAGVLRATLVNHSSVLLQWNGCNILTDPIWSERASPVSWAGPKRHRAPGVRREDLPQIDLLLLSHNHYDHLDLPTLRWIVQRDQPVFVTPLGVSRLVPSAAATSIHELDWGGSMRLGDLTVHAVPAYHFSARGAFDRNQTLWCGYMLEWNHRLVYFAGDTAFGAHFAQIRAAFAPPRLALLPIGAYAPRWFMSAVHMSPEQAVEAHKILQAETSLGIHHGTFQLTDEGLDAPRNELLQMADSSFTALANGQSVTVD